MLGLTANSTGVDVLGPMAGQLSAPDPAAIALLALLLFVAAALRRQNWFEAVLQDLEQVPKRHSRKAMDVL